MAATDTIRSKRTITSAVRKADPVDQAFLILRVGFTVAPILFGLDKFFNVMVDWPVYVAPWLDRLIPGTPQEFMYVVGVIEILAGIAVAFFPEFGGYLVAAWLGGIVVNLLTADPPRFYDVAASIDPNLTISDRGLGRRPIRHPSPRDRGWTDLAASASDRSVSPRPIRHSALSSSA